MGRLHLCFVFLATITAVYAKNATLQIQPSQATISKRVGESIALTCTPNVEDTSQVGGLEWRDPKNRKIDYNKANPIFVQKWPNQPGIILVFPSLTENQSGTYTCHANYGAEELNQPVQMETYMGIKFVDAPENQYPVIGKDFIVKCKVTGNPPPIIDWNKDGDSIVSNEKYVISDGNLIIKNVTESDDGVYKCQAVVVKSGETKSRNINVEVQIPPKITPMESVTIIEGETASIKCTAEGKPPPVYQWIKLRDRQDLAVADRFEVKKNTGELIMNRIEFYDDGVYKCIAENTVDRVEATVRINVLVKPRIFELLNVTAPQKVETLKIMCKVAGRPPPQVLFRKLSNTEPFKIGNQPDNPRITLDQQIFEDRGETFGTLIISNLNRSDDGLYECIAENRAGTAYKNGHITVEFPPTFERTKNLPPAWSWDNKPGNLSCIPEAIPNATIIWRKGGIEIRNNNNFKIEGNGPVSHLIVTPYNERLFYTTYECIATNKYGTASIGLELRHAEVPREIAEVKPETITATTIKWSIIPASHFEGLPIRSYTVRYKPNKELSWTNARNHTWSYGATYILENLTPEEYYDFRFAATNDVGMGAFKNVPSISMPKRSEPTEPRILVGSHHQKEDNLSDRENIVALSTYADHFELTWSVPNDNGDPILYYLIRYCVTEKVNGNWEDRDCIPEPIQRSVQYTSYQLDNLQPDTVYKIELRAYNAIGGSSPAQIRVRTARGIDPVVPVQSPAMSSAAIIGIVIGAILLVLLVLDITCYCINRIGLIALCCNSKSKRTDEEDPKLGREEQEPLKVEEKQMSLEFDGKHVYSKSGEIIGKHSAV
ncbi:fasciclin-2 isoform X2 [Anoplophora glabripennis]|nr:fasciclin-2 isoform X2 [Anoplophora glabripennis]